MPAPEEHKTAQARILAYAETIGWAVVSREEAERRELTEGGLSSPPDSSYATDRNARAPLSLFFDDLLDAKLRASIRATPKPRALLGQFRLLHADIHGNRPPVFCSFQRNRSFYETRRHLIMPLFR